MVNEGDRRIQSHPPRNQATLRPRLQRCTLITRKTAQAPETIKARLRIPILSWAFAMRADDGNRTRAVSLAIIEFHPDGTPGLQKRLPANAPYCPLITLPNGTLMARDQAADPQPNTSPAQPVPRPPHKAGRGFAKLASWRSGRSASPTSSWAESKRWTASPRPKSSMPSTDWPKAVPAWAAPWSTGWKAHKSTT